MSTIEECRLSLIRTSGHIAKLVFMLGQAIGGHDAAMHIQQFMAEVASIAKGLSEQYNLIWVAHANLRKIVGESLRNDPSHKPLTKHGR